jgi:hypothetical protein
LKIAYRVILVIIFLAIDDETRDSEELWHKTVFLPEFTLINNIILVNVLLILLNYHKRN